MPKDSFDKIFKNKKRVLVIMPHPDDAEIYCGGTIARLIGEGKEVGIVKLTWGSKGCKQERISEGELRRIREREDRAAMQVLGIKEENNFYLGIEDGTIENDLETIGKVALQIRLFKPDLIITTNPEHIVIRFDKGINWVNHRDHRNTAKNAIDAAYPYSRDLLFFKEHFRNLEAKSHTTTEFLLTDYYEHPDLVFIDVTDYADIRTKALASHASQYSLKDAQESTDFFTKHPSGRRFERLRYVITD